MTDKARTKLSVSCGCKFISYRIRAGKEHAEKTGHTLTVTGFILPPAIEKKVDPEQGGEE